MILDQKKYRFNLKTITLSRVITTLLAMVSISAHSQSNIKHDMSARALSVSAPWEITSLDPAKNGYIFTRLEIAETLVNVTNAGELTGGLATSWVTTDSINWRLKLRPKAKFHDGSAVTAEATVKSLERALTQPGVLRNASVKKISAVSGEVMIELNKPLTALPAFLAHNSTQILAAASYAADGTVSAVIGSGP